jgi:hypothetical protein
MYIKTWEGLKPNSNPSVLEFQKQAEDLHRSSPLTVFTLLDSSHLFRLAT